jgi:hypothetical protein
MRILLSLFISSAAMAGTNADLERIRQCLPNPKISETHILENTNRAYDPTLSGQQARVQRRKDLCFHDEREYLNIKRELLDTWQASWRTKSTKQFDSLMSKEFSGARLDQHQCAGDTVGGIQISKCKIEAELADNSSFKSSLKNYLSEFSKVDDFELVTLATLSAASMRNRTLDMEQANLRLRFDLRGLSTRNQRVQDRGEMIAAVVKKDGHWRLQGLTVSSWERLESRRAPAFTNISQPSGINKLVASYERTEAIRRGGYALSTNDIDGDGNVDMIVGGRDRLFVLKGNGKGGFTDFETHNDLYAQNLVKTALLADFDNDGKKDLALIRFAPTPAKAVKKNDVVIYRNTDSGFERVTTQFDDRGSSQAMPAAIGDFDRNGFLDLYVGYPGAKDFTFVADIKQPEELKVQGLYMNRGELKFEGSPKFDKLGWRQKLFPHSSLAVDFNDDGYSDILVMDDRGNLSPIYRNQKNGDFNQVADAIGAGNFGYGMGIAAGDLNGDGHTDLLMTNVNFHSGQRMNASCQQNWAINQLVPPTGGGLRALEARSDGRFADVTQAYGLTDVGEGAAGVELVDYNQDGLLDIYVANGLWSGTQRTSDISEFFVSCRNSNSNGSFIHDDSGFDQSQSIFTRFLHSNSPTQMAGFQRNRLFRNLGGGRFVEVGYMENVDSIADGYVVAFADLTSSGRPDLILRNGDPGTSAVKYAPVEIFRNDNPEKNNSLKIKLVGTASNRDAVGTRVEVTTKSAKQVKQLMANNGAAQSELALFFGLQKETIAKSVVVHWPSGAVQTLNDVKAGTQTITEPLPERAGL